MSSTRATLGLRVAMPFNAIQNTVHPHIWLLVLPTLPVAASIFCTLSRPYTNLPSADTAGVTDQVCVPARKAGHKIESKSGSRTRTPIIRNTAKGGIYPGRRAKEATATPSRPGRSGGTARSTQVSAPRAGRRGAAPVTRFTRRDFQGAMATATEAENGRGRHRQRQGGGRAARHAVPP